MKNKREFINHSIRGGSIVSLAVSLQFILGFLVQIILTRQLEPSLFGQVAFASAVGLFFNSLTDSAGDRFVVQEKSDPHEKLNNVFTLELILALFFFIFVFIFSPLVMNILGKSDSTFIVQVFAFSYFYNPLNRPRCIFERDLAFFRAKFPLIGAQVICAIITVLLVYSGYGIWSLIFWRLSVLVSEVIILWVIASYRPKIAWDKEIIKSILKFGWPLMIAGTLAFIVQNSSYFIIGTLEDSDTQAGYYWLALQFSIYFLKVRAIIYSVLFPIFSRVLEEGSKARIFVRITKAVSGLFLLPTLIVIFFGYEIIITVFGDKWQPSVFPFRIIFIAILIRGINSNIGYFLQSRGVTIDALVTASLNIVLLIPIGYFLTQKYGINGMAISVLLVDIIVSCVIYESFIKPLVGKGFIYFFSVPLLLSGVTFFLMYFSNVYEFNIVYRLMIFVVVLSVAYFFALREPLKDIANGMKISRDNSSM